MNQSNLRSECCEKCKGKCPAFNINEMNNCICHIERAFQTKKKVCINGMDSYGGCIDSHCPKCHTEEKKERGLTESNIDTSNVFIKTIPPVSEKNLDYERNYSHTHCWNQKQPPACNINIQNHKQCCLCDPATPIRDECILEEKCGKHHSEEIIYNQARNETLDRAIEIVQKVRIYSDDKYGQKLAEISNNLWQSIKDGIISSFNKMKK